MPDSGSLLLHDPAQQSEMCLVMSKSNAPVRGGPREGRSQIIDFETRYPKSSLGVDMNEYNHERGEEESGIPPSAAHATPRSTGRRTMA